MKVGDEVTITDDCHGACYLNTISTIEECIDYDSYKKFTLSNGLIFYDDELILYDSTPNTKPKHYKTDSIDVIDFCKLYDLNFNMGNIIKYACRKKEQDIEDLKKIIDYAQRELQYLEKCNQNANY